MLEIPLSTQQIIDEHRRVCPEIYQGLDMAMAPERYRSQPGERSSLWRKTSEADKQMMSDPHLQALFRQWAMAGDPLADAFARRFRDLKHHVAMAMLDTALEKGIEALDNPPPELVALMKEVDHVPEWVDWEAIDETARNIGPCIYALGQTAWRAAFILAFDNSYQGLPMYLTGALHKPETTPARIKETISVVNYLAIPGGLRRDGVAFKTLVRVRVMHGLVRTNLLQNAKAWDASIYGVPLPQVDMFAAWGIFASTLALMQKLSGHEANMNAMRYLMYLTGVDSRIPCSSVEDIHKVLRMIGATLNYRYEPWASELTSSALSAQLVENPGMIGRFWDRIDRRLCKLMITRIRGQGPAEKLGVDNSPVNYLAAATMSVPVVAKFLWLKIMEKLPGGRKWVNDFCLRYACKNMGIELKYDTNPDEYRTA